MKAMRIKHKLSKQYWVEAIVAVSTNGNIDLSNLRVWIPTIALMFTAILRALILIEMNLWILRYIRTVSWYFYRRNFRTEQIFIDETFIQNRSIKMTGTSWQELFIEVVYRDIWWMLIQLSFTFVNILKWTL